MVVVQQLAEASTVSVPDREETKRYLSRLPPSEVFNLASHLAGALAALVGLVWLVSRASGALATAAVAVYGASLVVLYSASTLHHAIPPTPGRRHVLRRLDHVSIYLLIMGTYAPPCLLALPRNVGLPILGVVWAAGLVGITLKIFRPFTGRWVTIAMYVAMGWAVVAAIPFAWQSLAGPGVALLLAGGIVYTVGAVVYATQKPDPFPRHLGFHGVWHIMVIVASVLHFWFIARYVPLG